jgi:hypothetical protein
MGGASRTASSVASVPVQVTRTRLSSFKIARGKASDQVAQLEEVLVGEGMCRVEREMVWLLVHRLGDLGHAMADRGDDG